jgi:hypothetical protein
MSQSYAGDHGAGQVVADHRGIIQVRPGVCPAEPQQSRQQKDIQQTPDDPFRGHRHAESRTWFSSRKPTLKIGDNIEIYPAVTSVKRSEENEVREKNIPVVIELHMGVREGRPIHIGEMFGRHLEDRSDKPGDGRQYQDCDQQEFL